MSHTNRRDLLEELAASNGQNQAAKEDKIFNKYANGHLPTGLQKTTSGLNAYTGPWTNTQAIHLLRRTTFGVKPSDISVLMGMTMDQAVDYLLSATPLPAPPVNNYNTSTYTDPNGIQTGDTWVNAPFGDSDANGKRRASLMVWWMDLMIHQNLNIREKMTFFWANHFGLSFSVVNDARMCYTHNALLRANALGNFKSLVKQVTKDAAMLKFLNGYLNISTAPDENYGRELQELFTVGKFNNPNYTEDDVKAAAKVLTGWTYNNSTLAPYFDPTKHNTGNKQFSAFYNNTVITGQTGANGGNEADELVDMIFSKYETALYICTKLYRYFVYYNIDANIQANVIEPMAQILVSNNFEILPVLTALFKSQHFYDANNLGCQIRTPLEFMVGDARTFGLATPSNFTLNQTFLIWNYMRNYTVYIGLDLGSPPSVAGYPAYYQVPVFYELWINSFTLPARMSWTDRLLTSGFDAATGTTIKIDVIAFAQQYANTADPDMFVDYCVSLLCGLPVSSAVHDSLKGNLLSGQSNNAYWTTAWQDFLNDPSAANTAIVKPRLTALFTAIMRMPEHQLC